MQKDCMHYKNTQVVQTQEIFTTSDSTASDGYNYYKVVQLYDATKKYMYKRENRIRDK